MPLLRAVPVVLSAGERTALSKRVRGAKTAHRDRLRAQIVLAAARGRDNARIAADLRISVDTVRKWRRARCRGCGQGGRRRPGARARPGPARRPARAGGGGGPTAPAARGPPVRVEHEYVRHGALALLAALDVHTGKVFAATPATTGIA